MTTRVDLGLDPTQPIIEGDDRLFKVRIANDIGGTPQPIPLGGSLNYAIFNEDPEVDDTIAAEFTYSIGNGITITDQTKGWLEIRLEGTDTQGLEGDKYHRLTMTSGTFSQRVFVGTIRFRPRASS